MIAGIGIDICKVERLKQGYNNYQDRFLKKIFTENEIKYCGKFANKFENFAGKFSVKEAFMKAVGKGIKQGLWFNYIEVLNDENQKPYLVLHKEAKKIYDELGIINVFVSITHTDDTAAAVVVIEK